MKPESISSMFDAIAPNYDFLNRLLSLRRDVYWRREMIQALDLPKKAMVLDVACGTGDVMIEILRQKPDAVAYGIDFSKKMLHVAGEKTSQSEYPSQTGLLAGDALHLPFPPNQMDAVTIAFGIRNVADRKKALENFLHVLKPGGKLAVLELNTPSRGMLRALYLMYFQKILPGIGGFFSKNPDAYQYLPDSVLNFPAPSGFAALMQRAGFSEITWKPLTFGICTLFTGQKE